MVEQDRDDLGRFMGLSEEQLDRFFELVRDGNRPSTAAKYFGCSPQAFSNRKRRDPEFRRKFMEAEAESEVETVRALRKFESDPDTDEKGKALPRGEWTSIAWRLERRFGWIDPYKREQTKKLQREAKRGSDSDLERQLRFRAIARMAMESTEGNPNITAATPIDSDDEGVEE